MFLSSSLILIFSILLLLIIPYYSYGIILLSFSLSLLNLFLLPFDIISITNILIYIIILLILLITNKNDNSAYNLSLIIIVTGMIFSINATNLAILFISLEIISMAIYAILVAYSYNYKTSIAYYILGSIMSGFFILGCGLIFMGINLGYYLIISMLIFKLGGAPLHFLLPNLYTSIPPRIILIFSTLYKLNAGIILFRFYQSNILEYDIIILSCVLSLIIGAIYGLLANNLYRLLAFSGIFNIGFLLIGLITNSIMVYLIYWFIYIIMTILYILLLPGNYIYNLNGLFENNKWLSLCWLILIFSFIGIPPFSGFFIKLYLISESILLGQFTLIFLSIFMIIISTGVYLRLLKSIFINKQINCFIIFNETLSHIIGILIAIISLPYLII